ncbi:MAG: hypothetical protein QXX09_06475 [Candidatus Methanomethylicia archaeon]
MNNDEKGYIMKAILVMTIYSAIILLLRVSGHPIFNVDFEVTLIYIPTLIAIITYLYIRFVGEKNIIKDL